MAGQDRIAPVCFEGWCLDSGLNAASYAGASSGRSPLWQPCLGSQRALWPCRPACLPRRDDSKVSYGSLRSRRASTTSTTTSVRPSSR